MFANTITSCDWGSAKALMADIDTEKLNVTELVAQCNNVCKVAFESNRNVRISHLSKKFFLANFVSGNLRTRCML